MNVSWILAVVAVLAGSAMSGPVAPRSQELLDDWQKFQGLLSGEKFTHMLEDHLLHDKEFNDAIAFFFSEEFKNVFKTIDGIDDVVKYYDYLEEAGMDVYQLINELHDVVGLPHISPEKQTRNQEASNDVTIGFLEDYMRILPIDKILSLHAELLKTSPAFVKFVAYWRAPRFYRIVEALRANDEFQQQLKIAKAGGIDINAIGVLYSAMAGLEFPSFERIE